MGASRYMRYLSYGIVLVGLWGALGYVRHGELPNLIPEAADNGRLEPCIREGARDGCQPTVEPAVVEGAPPVPMRGATSVIPLTQTADTTPPTATPYPQTGAINVYEDVVVKVVFSEPVTGVDATTVILTDAQGTAVPASVAQIGDYTWGLFPHQVFLTRGETYTARVAASVCDYAKNCLGQDLTWRFTITDTPGGGQGDTSIPLGGGSLPVEHTLTTRHTTAPLEPSVVGQAPQPQPDVARSMPTTSP